MVMLWLAHITTVNPRTHGEQASEVIHDRFNCG